MADHFDAPMKFGIGQPVRRYEDVRLLTGRGHYQDDNVLPRQAWCIFVRSPHAHALIRSIDTDAAKAAPGWSPCTPPPIMWPTASPCRKPTCRARSGTDRRCSRRNGRR